MTQWQKQPSGAPTNKVMTTVVGTSVLFTMMGPAISEAWPLIEWIPVWAKGPNMVNLASVAIPSLLAGGIAWFIPNRAATGDE